MIYLYIIILISLFDWSYSGTDSYDEVKLEDIKLDEIHDERLGSSSSCGPIVGTTFRGQSIRIPHSYHFENFSSESWRIFLSWHIRTYLDWAHSSSPVLVRVGFSLTSSAPDTCEPKQHDRVNSFGLLGQVLSWSISNLNPFNETVYINDFLSFK